MKKLFLILALLIIITAAPADAWNPAITQSGVTTPAAGGCPGGTYLFYWDGDHPSGENFACVDSGNSTLEASSSSGDHVNTNGGGTGKSFERTADNQYLSWTITAKDIINYTVGTTWSGVKIGNLDADHAVWESYNSGTNQQRGALNSSQQVTSYYEGNNSSAKVTGNDAVTQGSWGRTAWTWQADAGADTHCVQFAGNGWDCEDDITDMTAAPGTFKIGVLDGASAGTTTIYIDEVYVTGSYQSADPL